MKRKILHAGPHARLKREEICQWHPQRAFPAHHHAEPPGTADPFKYVCNLSLADLKEKLEAVKLSGLAARLWSAIEKLRGQSAATGAALNAKFAAEGDAFKGEMGFGGVEQFYGGVLHASSWPTLPALSHRPPPLP